MPRGGTCKCVRAGSAVRRRRDWPVAECSGGAVPASERALSLVAVGGLHGQPTVVVCTHLAAVWSVDARCGVHCGVAGAGCAKTRPQRCLVLNL